MGKGHEEEEKERGAGSCGRPWWWRHAVGVGGGWVLAMVGWGSDAARKCEVDMDAQPPGSASSFSFLGGLVDTYHTQSTRLYDQKEEKRRIGWSRARGSARFCLLLLWSLCLCFLPSIYTSSYTPPSPYPFCCCRRCHCARFICTYSSTMPHAMTLGTSTGCIGSLDIGEKGGFSLLTHQSMAMTGSSGGGPGVGRGVMDGIGGRRGKGHDYTNSNCVLPKRPSTTPQDLPSSKKKRERARGCLIVKGPGPFFLFFPSQLIRVVHIAQPNPPQTPPSTRTHPTHEKLQYPTRSVTHFATSHTGRFVLMLDLRHVQDFVSCRQEEQGGEGQETSRPCKQGVVAVC